MDAATVRETCYKYIYDRCPVMAAVGRQADTDNLGLDQVGVDTSPKNKKIVCTNKQTSCPNIYAIGDVMEVSVWR